MATAYSKIDGQAVEVPDHILAELQAFEESPRSVMANLSSKPVEWTHNRMMGLGQGLASMRRDQAKQSAAERAQAERKRLEPPAIDPKPGSDWADLTGE